MKKSIPLQMLCAICLLLTGCRSRYQVNPYEVVDQSYEHTYGIEVPEMDWNARGCDGKVFSTLTNGVQVCRNYSSGVLEGETVYSYPYTDTPHRVVHYNNGTATKEVHYSQSGTPQREIKIGHEKERATTIWYDNGSPKSMEYHDSHGSLTSAEYYDMNHQQDAAIVNGEGCRLVRDPYGSIISKEIYKNGQMFSKTNLYPNGTPKEEIHYTNGKIDGTVTKYNTAGEPYMAEQWVNGQQNGITIKYQNGEKAAEIPYSNGRKNGIEHRYADGTKLIEEISWKDNQRHGPSLSYYDDKTKTTWFYQGQAVSPGNFKVLHGPWYGSYEEIQ